MSLSRLYLVTPVLAEAEPFLPALSEALGAADIASLLLRFGAIEETAAVRLIGAIAAPAQAKGVAVVIEGDPALVAKSGVDGAHVKGAGEALLAAIKRLSPGHIVGAGGLATRHDAMLAGEAGADYLLFGETPETKDQEELIERVHWWAEIFNTPCVAFAQDLGDVGPLVEAGADFIMLGDCVWRDARGSAAALRDAQRLIAEHEAAP